MARMALLPLWCDVACVRRPAARAHHVSPGALALGHDLAAAALGLGDEHVAVARALLLDRLARADAADLLVGVEQERERQPPRHLVARQLPEGGNGQHQPALHVVDAGAVDLVALAPERQGAGQRADGVHGVDVAQHQDARLVAAGIAGHAQHVAEPVVVGLEALEHRAGAFEPAGDRVQHAVDAGLVAGGALDARDGLDVGQDGVGVDAAVEERGHALLPNTLPAPFGPAVMVPRSIAWWEFPCKPATRFPRVPARLRALPQRDARAAGNAPRRTSACHLRRSQPAPAARTGTEALVWSWRVASIAREMAHGLGHCQAVERDLGRNFQRSR